MNLNSMKLPTRLGNALGPVLSIGENLELLLSSTPTEEVTR